MRVMGNFRKEISHETINIKHFVLASKYNNNVHETVSLRVLFIYYIVHVIQIRFMPVAPIRRKIIIVSLRCGMVTATASPTPTPKIAI